MSDIDKAIKFALDHMPSFTWNEVTKEYDVSFYNRRNLLMKGSQDHHDQMTERYIKAFHETKG